MELSVSHLIINFVPGVFHKRRNKISTRETIFDQLEKSSLHYQREIILIYKK